MEETLFYRFGVALFIGILVGLQREHDSEGLTDPTREMFAGVRTFALMGIAGCMMAFVAEILASPFVFVGLFVPFGMMIVVAYFVTARRGEVGMTTEMAALVTILAGALCYWNQLVLAIAIGVMTTALLSFKFELHRLAQKLTQEDIVASLKFAIITAIVLPILPNESFWPAPFDVLNPYKIWLMVVLISAISFSGYILMKLVGSHRGIVLTGFLGGVVSSTAVTLSFSQRSHNNKQLVKPFALAIILAWTVMFGRVLIEIAALNLPLLQIVWLPITAAGGVGLAYCVYLYFAPHPDEVDNVTVSNPFELGPAVQFGLLYGAILLIARTAQFYFGDTGVYLSSVIAGLADVDAITLTMAELSNNGSIDIVTAARAIVLATMSNTVVKGGVVLSMGTAVLRRTLLPAFLLILATGISLAFAI